MHHPSLTKTSKSCAWISGSIWPVFTSNASRQVLRVGAKPRNVQRSCLANWYTMAFLWIPSMQIEQNSRETTRPGAQLMGAKMLCINIHMIRIGKIIYMPNTFTVSGRSCNVRMGLRLGESFPCWKVVGAGVCLAFSCFFPVDIGTFWMSQLTHGLTHEDRHEQDGTDTHRKEFRLCGSVVLF